MLKTSKTDKVVVLENFTLFSLLFHADILNSQWMNMECLFMVIYESSMFIVCHMISITLLNVFISASVGD